MIGDDNLLIAYAITDFIACLTPGPAVMAVTGIALTGSLRGMAGAIIGINSGNILWYIMVGAGLVALAHSVPELFIALRWAGIVYLFWMGVDTWRSHMHLSMKRAGGTIGMGRGLASGIAVQLSNPKALIFFTVFLPPFIDMHRPVARQILTLAAIGITLEVLVLVFYGLLAYRLGRLAISERAERWVARCSGAMLLAIAIAMALSHFK